jgi:hypothetical protein
MKFVKVSTLLVLVLVGGLKMLALSMNNKQNKASGYDSLTVASFLIFLMIDHRHQNSELPN